MLQGDAYKIEFGIKENGAPITPENANDVEIVVGKIIKSYAEGTLSFNNGKWIFPLSQQETYSFTSSGVNVQVRVLFKSGDVKGIRGESINVEKSLVKTILGEKHND